MADDRFILLRIVRPKKSLHGWGWVLLGGVLLTVLAVMGTPTGGVGAATGSTTVTADGSTGCQMQVTSTDLKVRAGPSTNTEVLETLVRGALVDATTGDVVGGFRRLEGDRWAANEFLVPVAGTTC